jgi:hypothetical protein
MAEYIFDELDYFHLENPDWNAFWMYIANNIKQGYNPQLKHCFTTRIPLLGK